MRTLAVASSALLLVACGARTGLRVPEAGVDGCVPSAETCDLADNDCDGTVDDGLTCYTLDGAPVAPVRTSACGGAWYAYGTPDPESANPAPDIRASGRVAVAIVESPAACGGVGIAVIADRPNDGSGGSLGVSFEVTPASARTLLVGDEPSECRETGAGAASCAWTWQACCTDGALFGPLAGNFCARLTFSRPVGVASVVVIDGPRAIEQRFERTMTLCGRTTPEVR